MSTQHNNKCNTPQYSDFISSKTHHDIYTGFEPDEKLLSDKLFPFQKDIIKWACRHGHPGIFAGTGLGKTAMQLSMAWQVYNHLSFDDKILILAPLAVGPQTQQEGLKFSIPSTLIAHPLDVKPGINITNYDKLHKFDPSEFAHIILDESSIIKNFTGKIRNTLIQSFARTPYKLAATATPSPNDYMELGNHAEFLGVRSYNEMLAEFFVHDGGDTSKWRLKGHAQKAFWEWLASFACVITKPSDLGYDDGAFALPKLNIYDHIVPSEQPTEGFLFAMPARTLTERRGARRDSLSSRIKLIQELALDKYKDQIYLIWCDLNDEADELEKLIPGSIQIAGRHEDEYKSEMMLNFAKGNIQYLITKPKIAGFGMNWQVCHNMAFAGLSDSFEAYFQAVRRCWRFGQTEEVNVDRVTSETESSVLQNVDRKEREANLMLDEMVKLTKEITKMNIQSNKRQTDLYLPNIEMRLPEWLRTKEGE